MKNKKTIIVLVVLCVALVAIRIALPYIAKSIINKKLNNIEGYSASIDDIDFGLYRGAIQIEGLKIFEEASSNPNIPFVSLPLLDFSIHWKALLHGKFVSEVEMQSLEVNFVKLKVEDKDQSSRKNFAEQLQAMNPIEINEFLIKDGKISYKDGTVSPKVDVYLDNLYLTAHNLSNVVDNTNPLPATVKINSNAMGKGTINVDVKLNILKNTPDFDLNIACEKIDMVKFNNFMDAYADLNLKDGKLNLYSETVAKNAMLKGYVKPVIEDFELDKSGEEKKLGQKLYEGLVGVAAKVVENDKKQTIASRIEISGSLENTKTSTWETVINLLRNAFIEAYAKEIENVVHFGNTNTKEK